MTRDEVIALEHLGCERLKEWASIGPVQRAALEQYSINLAAAIEERVRQTDPALRLVADIRFALGDDGKRMQAELVEYCKELRRDAERYQYVRRKDAWKYHDLHVSGSIGAIFVSGDDGIGHALDEYELDAAIDAAMQTQSPDGA